MWFADLNNSVFNFFFLFIGNYFSVNYSVWNSSIELGIMTIYINWISKMIMIKIMFFASAMNFCFIILSAKRTLKLGLYFPFSSEYGFQPWEIGAIKLFLIRRITPFSVFKSWFHSFLKISLWESVTLCTYLVITNF